MRCRRSLILTSVVAIAAFALLAAGCGGGGSPGVATVAATAPAATTTTTTQSGLLAFSQCMSLPRPAELPRPAALRRRERQADHPPSRTAPGSLERLQSPAPDERRRRFAGNGPAAAHPACGRAVVRQVYAQPRRGPLPRSDRAGSTDGRDGPGAGDRRALTGNSADRAGVPAGLARRAHASEGQTGAQQRRRRLTRVRRRHATSCTREADPPGHLSRRRNAPFCSLRLGVSETTACRTSPIRRSPVPAARSFRPYAVSTPARRRSNVPPRRAGYGGR